MGELINGRTPEEIKRRLKCASFDCGAIDCDDCECRDLCKSLNVFGDAADAISLIERLEAERDAALVKVPRWISVEERLPENEESVIIAGWREGISGKLWPVVMTAFHVDGEMLAQDSKYTWSDGNVELKYDEDADDFIVPEGWFEDVQCADEFSMVDGIRVTHWMPMPSGPEEEG